ncbi:MAG: flagellar biosynthesis anti-sigma factor FlgM [Pyrinomonadaceae bacterium]
MNIHKIDNSTPIRAELQNDIKTSAEEAARPVGNKAAVGEDRVEFSSRASEVGKLVDQVKQMPDIREGKVSDLRQRIEAGTYKPSSENIADAILNDERS